MVDARAVSEGHLAPRLPEHDDPAREHDDPVEELFEDQVKCADLLVISKSDQVDEAALGAVEAVLEREARPATRRLRSTGSGLPASVLLGLDAEAEANMAGRDSHHDGEHEPHDHDDFDSFVVDGPQFGTVDEARGRIERILNAPGVLRVKGRVGIEGRSAPLVVQGVGNRLETFFEPGSGDQSPCRHWARQYRSAGHPFGPVGLMHLTAADIERIDDGEAAVDLEQSPGDIVFLSAADSELTGLARALGELSDFPLSFRMANIMRLGHPLSVDLYLERTVASAKLVVVRIIGGHAYWTYGLDELRALSRREGFALIVVSGDARWDGGLEAFCSVPIEQARALWRLLVEGGPSNLKAALEAMAALAAGGNEVAAPEVVPAAGFYLPDRGLADFEEALSAAGTDRPAVPIIFYRSVLLGGLTDPVDSIFRALSKKGLAALPIFVVSIRDREAVNFLEETLAETSPALIINTTAFAASGGKGKRTVLDAPGRPVLQAVLAGSSEEAWQDSLRGMTPRDLTMNVVLPEVDGRIGTRAVSFKAESLDPTTDSRITVYRPVADRVAVLAEQAERWVRLGAKQAGERRVALILSNYPNRDGRIGNGVGLDAPESTVRLVKAMADAGYVTDGFPDDSASLMELLLAGVTNAEEREKPAEIEPVRLTLAAYCQWLKALPEESGKTLEERWGPPEKDPFFRDGAFELPVHRFGNLAVGVQPARGYNIDPKATYHDPDLVPPHGYLAFYVWLRQVFDADAIVHVGKHGNLEWLPGKALGLSKTCWPEIALGPTPLIYPFIVNDPGEGMQAKRRSSAVIVDHLMPALARAEIHGDLAKLETLIDEYYLATGIDQRRRQYLRDEILSLAASTGLDRDLGFTVEDGDAVLQELDAHLCELKELQIRDGLHILGQSPTGRQRAETLVSLARNPRGSKAASDASLLRAIAEGLGLGNFDPLDCDMAEPWSGPRPEQLQSVLNTPWRTAGDTVERLEVFALYQVESGCVPALNHAKDQTGAVLAGIRDTIAPALDESGIKEVASVLAALDGRFVRPGPSGAPSRGRPEVLPTGRNFFSVDVRAVPTPAAWALGQKGAEALALRYFQDEGEWPRSIALSAWSTSNMRTGGDDIAQVLALIGAEPQWQGETGRVTGFRVKTLSELERPRIDVTLKISGMFRDSFPEQIDLIDSAMRAVGRLKEPDDANPIAAANREALAEITGRGIDERVAERLVGSRIFGAKPGAYGAGMQALIDEGIWSNRADFTDAFLAWGGFVYGGGYQGEAARERLADRLREADAVLHNQDNREHDLLDSDDYYQFQGGLAATIETLKGEAVPVYHGDNARPEKPVVRSLKEEIARTVRGRAANPKWIAGVMRHGYKGAFEIAATVDYLFAYAAMTDAVGDHHFDQLFDAYIADESVRCFLAENNAPALKEIAARFREAIDRGLWSPRSNSAYDRLSALSDRMMEAAP